MAGIQKKDGFKLNPHSGIVQQPRCAWGKFSGIGSGAGSEMAEKWQRNGWEMAGKWQRNLQRICSKVGSGFGAEKNIYPDLTPPPILHRFSSHTALFMRACHVHTRRPS